MSNMPDHPDIVMAERTGYPYPTDPEEEVLPRCPICGIETDTLIQTREYEIVGCDLCTRTVDAWEWADGVRVSRRWSR